MVPLAVLWVALLVDLVTRNDISLRKKLLWGAFTYVTAEFGAAAYVGMRHHSYPEDGAQPTAENPLVDELLSAPESAAGRADHTAKARSSSRFTTWRRLGRLMLHAVRRPKPAASGRSGSGGAAASPRSHIRKPLSHLFFDVRGPLLGEGLLEDGKVAAPRSCDSPGAPNASDVGSVDARSLGQPFLGSRNWSRRSTQDRPPR